MSKKPSKPKPVGKPSYAECRDALAILERLEFLFGDPPASPMRNALSVIEQNMAVAAVRGFWPGLMNDGAAHGGR